MDKVWLKSYPEGVPAEIDIGSFSSIPDLIDRCVPEFAARTAFVNVGSSIRYDALYRHARSFAAYLQNEIGVQPGHVLAIMMPNTLTYPVALFGALMAGCVIVNCNPLYTPRELQLQLADSGVQTIVVLENFGWVVAEAQNDTRLENVIVTRLGDLLGWSKGIAINAYVRHVKRLVRPWSMANTTRFTDTLGRGAHLPFKAPRLSRHSVAFLQYTGGTTGVPKAAILTHGNILASVLQAEAWLSPFVDGSEQTIVTPLPLYHVFALVANCLAGMKMGVTNLLITNPRDTTLFIKAMAKSRFALILGVETLFAKLLDHPDFANVDFSKLHGAFAGGMPLSRQTADRWRAVTGTPLLEAYGLTEAPGVAIHPIDFNATYSGSIGLPVPSCDVAVLDDNDVRLPANTVGEIVVRGPQVMTGYWNAPGETERAFTKDGFLRTGDLGTMDEDGFLRIVDRKKDTIIVSGFNVYPSEIETIVSELSGVQDVAVIGVPDSDTGEAVALYLVADEERVSEQSVREHCGHSLTAYKNPKHIEFCADLPKTIIGKVSRRELRGTLF